MFVFQFLKSKVVKHLLWVAILNVLPWSLTVVYADCCPGNCCNLKSEKIAKKVIEDSRKQGIDPKKALNDVLGIDTKKKQSLKDSTRKS